MFTDIEEKTNSAKSFLIGSNRNLDSGELHIEEGNSNKVTDAIIDSIEAVEKQTNSIYDEITSINTDIKNFNDAINESKRIRQEELKRDDPGETDLDIRDIM